MCVEEAGKEKEVEDVCKRSGGGREIIKEKEVHRRRKEE